MVYVAPDSGLTNTFGFLNSGRYFEMLSSMLFCTVAPIRSSRSADMPTVSGFAAGSSCATAAVATSAHIALKMQSSAQAPILLRTGFRDLLATKPRVLPESEELALLGN